jgi:hypothetical protein
MPVELTHENLVFIQVLVRRDLRDGVSATTSMTKNYYDDMRQEISMRYG